MGRNDKNMRDLTSSPFFQPSDPRTLRRMATPNGTVHLKQVKDEAEHKSNILGATANLIVSIVGAGIVGIPYALRESGLVAGVFMVFLCAVITEKSLRLLVETAKHIDVPSYEVLYEASFGYGGFIAMSLIMFCMSYGAMVSYMMIMKDTLSNLVGVAPTDVFARRIVLVTATMLILFPLSAQRDMADLAKTSRVSVVFYFVIVSFVIFNSPVRETVKDNGGLGYTVKHDILRPETFFTGLGVLSFAYVCQHSAFIIAGSLKRPTKQRWGQVTFGALLISGTLAFLCGVFGYLGFLQDTDGNVLTNFEALGNPVVKKLANVARSLLVVCMFFVYPMDAFVSRHVCVVLLFKGRRAHEGDDHSVLARTDRRILLTLALIGITMLPALLLEDLGVVLAITGAIAGSFLSYIGPGTAYLAVHGEEFIRISGEWAAENDNVLSKVVKRLCWYLLLMPIWSFIARTGQASVEQHVEKEALKSPHPSRLGKVVHHNPKLANLNKPRVPFKSVEEGGPLLKRNNSEPRSITDISRPPIGYGAVGGGNRGVEDALAKQRQEEEEEDEPENDPQEAFPAIYDFLIAIGFIIFGMIAMCVGLLSIYLDS